ncbi:MAG: hypothetical protein Q4G03_11055 [Planctomycetia bacterium]|nr:hypothetical protein [Planctomycetia bacterium]
MKQYMILPVALLALLAVVATGCNKGPKKVLISGTVSVAGEAVGSGSITFDPADGQGGSDGGKIVDGKFECEVTPGEKNVKCYGTKIVGTFNPDPLNPDIVANKYEDFPAKVFTEEIKITVNKKGDTFDINYTGEGAKK